MTILHAERPEPIQLWPDHPPGKAIELPPEKDTTQPDGNLVAGRRVIRLGNVSTPTIQVFKPSPERDTGASVVICPGGGHYILAMDLEGTEVVEWLNAIGVTGVLLKYRVPARDPERRWIAAVQDAQRAVSMVRSHAREWNLDPNRIGILGFSAGGETAALTSLFKDRQYEAVDDIDRTPARPNFAILVYPGGIANKENTALRDYIQVTPEAPPMFFAHAFDDRVRIENSLLLAKALKDHEVPAEVHIFAKGGHGFGLRATEDPCTHWPIHCHAWMQSMRIIR